MKLVRSLLAVALSVGFIAELGPAAVEQVSVRVDGLACPFCAYNIEKRVKTLEGVERDASIVTSISLVRFIASRRLMERGPAAPFP